jgi:CheY-like chemotaxis protein
MAHILIIEDDAPLQEAYSFILKADGHVIASAYNGKEGLELATNNHYDIILLDLHMPIMDGWDFLKAFKSHASPDTKIILFSNMVEKDTHKQAEELGVYQSILKSSMTPSAMLSLIKDLT